MLHDPFIPAEKIEAVHALMASAGIHIAFQPIVDVRRHRLHAYEALARCAPAHFSGPSELFATAVRAGRVGELGRMHREQASRICAGQPLFLNIEPNELDQGWLVRPDDPIFRHRGQVTLEITETAPIHYFAQCHSILAEIRAKGVQLAIDDFGAGFSNLKYIADLEPEIVKLDRQLITNLASGTGNTGWSNRSSSSATTWARRSSPKASRPRPSSPLSNPSASTSFRVTCSPARTTLRPTSPGRTGSSEGDAPRCTTRSPSSISAGSTPT